MRPIKFRGFNEKHQQWLYGFYLQNRGAHFVCPDEFADGKTWDDYEVRPDTVGQYTGLTDKQGREIYEGDVVRFANGDRLAVRWDERNCFYTLVDEDDYIIEGLDANEPEDYEIIGNIHDNPELLTNK